MFNSYPNFFESYYFYHLASSAPYFNYDPFLNSAKISSNIILTERETKSQAINFQEQKCQETKSDSQSSSSIQRKQKFEITKKLKKIKAEKQVLVKKQKKIVKTQKKVDMIQKQGRNSHSNILRKFFKLLSVKNEFKSAIEIIIEKHRFEITVEEFLVFIGQKSIDHRNYIRVKQVQWLFQQNQNQFNKITRILFQNYLKNYYIEHLLSSKKTDNKSIAFHLKGRRTIVDQILSKQYFGESECESSEN